ncbi:beta-lactamase/transpeptidase-like protein [Fomes fomentarius]|nr:beta-lactamase/transpeptidase-like protein [Fomes fomentarius]
MFALLLRLFLTSTTVRAATQVFFQQPTTSDSLISPQFGSFIDEIRNNGSIPGISIGVVRLDNEQKPVAQLGSWGQKTEDGDGHDLTPDTLFGLASCSKAFLATSVGLLIDDFAHGRNKTPLPPKVTHFDYDTKVTDILPDELGWSLHDLDGDMWATRKASIRDILGHVSGLPRHDYTYYPDDQPEDVIRRMGGLRTAYELREKWSYNNQMYMLGAYLVSHYAGVPYHQYATEKIFEPLDMSSTTFFPSAAHRSGKLTHSWTRDGRRIPYWFDDNMAALKAGPGGIISNAEDMVRWLAVWLNEGVDPVSGQTIFPQSVYEATTAAQHVVYGQPSARSSSIVGYGMGWQRWHYGGIEIVNHGGGIPGFSLLTSFSPSHNVGIFVAANAAEKSVYTNAILTHTLDVLFGQQTSENGELRSSLEELQTVHKPLDVRPPSFELDAYTGEYTAFGYKRIVLCSSKSRSEYCKDVLADFSTVDGSTASLYSTYKSIWTTHARLEHFSGDVFNITFTSLFPQGYGRNTSAFEDFEVGSGDGWVEFVVRGDKVAGFSLVLDEDAVAARARHLGGGHLPETGDAWFVKT